MTANISTTRALSWRTSHDTAYRALLLLVLFTQLQLDTLVSLAVVIFQYALAPNRKRVSACAVLASKMCSFVGWTPFPEDYIFFEDEDVIQAE